MHSSGAGILESIIGARTQSLKRRNTFQGGSLYTEAGYHYKIAVHTASVVRLRGQERVVFASKIHEAEIGAS